MQQPTLGPSKITYLNNMLQHYGQVVSLQLTSPQ